jgi:FkbM family methyltransferase
MIDQNLLKKIALVINSGKGSYIEAGANDGLTFSNTLILEKELGWSGLLIEPSVIGYNKLVINRPDNINVNAALVSFDYSKDEISGNFNSGGLMSKVNPELKFKNLLSFLRKIKRKIRKEEINVPALTLQSILDRNFISEVDFFSLDVEGYEVEVLKGLNFKKLKPKAILIEVRATMIFELCELLLNDYQLILNMSEFNFEKDPYWCGTHQDYLFVRSDYVNSVNLILESEKSLL